MQRFDKPFPEYREQFSRFYEGVKELHLASVAAGRLNRGHGLDHDVTVAQWAARFAPDPLTAEKAWCAGLLHSVDRLVDKDQVEHATRALANRLMQFPYEDMVEIIDAALRHAELNQDDQSLTQQCLMDGDRIANMMPAVAMRAGQGYPHLPALQLEHLDGERNPKSTYMEPQSVLDDLRSIIREYIPQLRMENARVWGAHYEKLLRAYIQSVEDSHRTLGLAGITL